MKTTRYRLLHPTIALLLLLGGVAWVPRPARDAEVTRQTVLEGVALTAGDTVDLTWRPEEYPDGTFIRLELYRGPSTDALSQIATISSAAAWRYRDTGLAPKTAYVYRAVLYYHPSANPDTERSTTLFTNTANTGIFRGDVYESVTLPGGVYELGGVTVHDGATLTIPGGVRLETGGGITAENGYLRITGVQFDDSTYVRFGSRSPAAWGEGWLRNSTFGQFGGVTVYSDHAVEISDNVLGPYAAIDAGDASGYVVVRRNTGPSSLTLGGTGAATDNDFGFGSGYGSATLENNVFGKLWVYENATARFNRVTGRSRGSDAATLENNVLEDELDLVGEALARWNDIANGVEVGDNARLEENTISGDVTVDEDAPGVTLLGNVIGQGRLVVANDYSCDTDPATVYAEGNTISAPTGDWAITVSGGAHATLVNNEIDGSIEVTQECTQFTARQNLIDGGIAICWDPAITITENVLDGAIYVGNAFPLTCSGDASGTIARNTIQKNYGDYDPALYLSRRLYTESHADLAVQHNCFQHNTIAARLFTIPEHGLVDLRHNWWGDASGPNSASNPGGSGGRIENLQDAPLTFDPWDTDPTYCRDTLPITRRVGGVEVETPATIRPDGVSQGTVRVTVYDQYGWSLPNASVSLRLVPEGLGQLSPEAVTTDVTGQATVQYTAPALGELGFHDAVEVRAISGAAQDWDTISFEAPDALVTAEPRYHEEGWSKRHALLPPDPGAGLHATLGAQLTYDGEPVRHYTVTVEIDPMEGGVYDGVFVAGSEVVPPLTERQVTLLTDDNGELWVKYRYTGQASRRDSVRDGVILRSEAFDHLGSWEVETGMDLAIVDVRRPGASQNDYLVMGQAEPMEIIVHDRLHPRFHLSAYGDDDDPGADPLLDVWLDVSDASITPEFFDLLLLDHFQSPGERAYQAQPTLAADGQDYLRVSEGQNVAGRPVIVPHFEGWNLHWIGVHLRRHADGRIIRDTAPQEETSNNYEIIRYQANAERTAWELFLRDNPCAPNTPWGRAAKCTLNVLSWVPASKVQAEVVSTMLALCETMFNIGAGRTEEAALGAGSTYASGLGWFLEAHPEVLAGTGHSEAWFKALGTLGNAAKVMDCYNALTDWSGELLPVGVCAMQARSTAPSAALPDQTAIWVQGLLQNLEGDQEVLAIVGSQQSRVIDAVAGRTVITATGAMTDTAETYYSLVNDQGSFYLLPRSTYSVTARTVTDTQVILFRQGVTITQFSTVVWEDTGVTPRRMSFTFGPTQTTGLQVDEGADGSVERVVPTDETPHLTAPDGLQVTVKSNDSVQVAWEPVEGAHRYRVYYGTESRWMNLFEGYEHQEEVYHPTASKNVADLALDGWAYYVTVTAVDEDGNESPYGAEVTVGQALRPRPLYLPLVLRAD